MNMREGEKVVMGVIFLIIVVFILREMFCICDLQIFSFFLIKKIYSNQNLIIQYIIILIKF